MIDLNVLMSLFVLAAVVVLGIKIIKNVITTAILIAILLAVLWFAGYLHI